MAFKLRPYQEEILVLLKQAISEGHRHILLGAPTGFGKTAISKSIVDGIVEKDNRVLFTAHRKELIYQTFKTFDRPGAISVSLGSEGAYSKNKPIQLGSLQTISSRLRGHGKGYLGKINVVLIDEAHYGHGSAMQKKIFELYGDEAIVIGLSATPIDALGYRLEGYDTTLYPVQTDDLIAMGYLVPVECYAPIKPDLSAVKIQAGDYALDQLESVMDDSALIANTYEVWEKHGAGKKTVVFCVSIAHAELVEREFKEHGIKTGVIHSKISKTQRDETIRQFHTGEIQVITNVDVLTTGWDEPTVECLLLARPTKSLRLYIQIIGRGLRISPETGKDSCLVLDCAGNIDDNGYPTARRNFNREKPPKGKKKKPAEVMETPECDTCGRMVDPAKRHRTTNETSEAIETIFKCPFCAATMSVNVINKREMELQKIEEKQQEMDAKTVYYHKMTNQFGGYKELQKLGKKAGYKAGWAWVQSKAITENNIWPFAAQVFQRVEGMGLQPSDAINEIYEKIKEIQA